MSEKIEPALTPEEWPTESAQRGQTRMWLDEAGLVIDIHGGGQVQVFPPQLHTLAALALHGQPFGVTREDVMNLRDDILANALEPGASTPKFIAWVTSLAARIEALLPPLDSK